MDPAIAKVKEDSQRKITLESTVKDLVSSQFERVILVEKEGGVFWGIVVAREEDGAIVALKASRAGVKVETVKPFEKSVQSGYLNTLRELRDFLRTEGLERLIEGSSSESKDQSATE
jgi:hypothetical protein